MSALIPALIKLLMSRGRGGGGGGGGGGAPKEPPNLDEKHQKIWGAKLMGLVDDDLGRAPRQAPDDPYDMLPRGKYFDAIPRP